MVDEREAENHAFFYPSWARNMYGNAWARIMYGNAEFQIFLLFGRLVLEKLNEKAVPPLRGRQRGETVFLEAVPTWGLDAGCGEEPLGGEPALQAVLGRETPCLEA